MAIRSPGSSQRRVRQFAHRGWTTRLYRHLPKVLSGRETHKFAVGRPERQIRTPRAIDFSRCIPIQILYPEVSYSARAFRIRLVFEISDDISDVAAVGRDHRIISTPLWHEDELSRPGGGWSRRADPERDGDANGGRQRDNQHRLAAASPSYRGGRRH